MADRVLITGARAPAALDFARSFKKAGFEVHAADCAPSCLATSSRAVSALHRYPSPRFDLSGFRQAMSELIARLTPVIVVPTCEEVFYAAGLDRASIFAPPPAVLRRLHSKHVFAQDAAAIGLAAPETTRVTSSAELTSMLSGGVVFKPEFSRFGTQTLIEPTRENILALRPSPQAAWVAQNRVHGAEVSFYAVSVESRLTAFSAYQSPWKFDGGAGYAFETLEPALHDQLLEIASTIAQMLVPRGQFACDLIVDSQGVAWLLECNPRATSGVHLFDRDPALARAMLGHDDRPLLAPRIAHKHVGPALWTYGLITALKHKRLREWRVRRKESSDVISAPGDRAPVAGALIDTLRMGASALFLRKTLTEIATIDIEWNGEPL